MNARVRPDKILEASWKKAADEMRRQGACEDTIACARMWFLVGAGATLDLFTEHPTVVASQPLGRLVIETVAYITSQTNAHIPEIRSH